MASAVELLQEERRRLADELKRIDQAIALLTKGKASVSKNGRRNRRKMSAAERKAVSDRMTKYWAARRRAKKGA